MFDLAALAVRILAYIRYINNRVGDMFMDRRG